MNLWKVVRLVLVVDWYRIDVRGLALHSFFLFFFQYCFEIYSADNSSGLIKACKTDSEGKVVEGQKVSINEKKLTPIEQKLRVYESKRTKEGLIVMSCVSSKICLKENFSRSEGNHATPGDWTLA